MPNFNLIHDLKRRYYETTQIDDEIIDFINKSETEESLKKAFQSEVLQRFSQQLILENFVVGNRPNLIQYFECGIEEEVTLLYLDITSFSTKINGWTNNQIDQYLDNYYSQIIPIIYSNGGEIEKVMGDGIICLFGKPFLNLQHPDYILKAEKSAKEAIETFHGTDKEVKVAIHNGTVRYYKVSSEQYSEYTMIGQTLTDLYRLESVAENNAINFFSGSQYDQLGWRQSIFNCPPVLFSSKETQGLKGTDFNQVKYFKLLNYN